MFPNSTLLGPGKSGSVYRSTHPHNGQPVLVKLLPWDGAAPNALDTEMIVRLVPQLSQLSGMNLARLIGVEQWDTGLGLVSEFVSAPTLSQHPDKGKFSPKEALDIANQLINALCDGERLRIIHGDLKPSNVLINKLPDGRPQVKLTDWGLSQARSLPPVESLLFTAPERLDGSPATLRGDLFSLGHVLFYLLTGMALVKGRTAQEIAQSWETAAPEHLKKIRKDLPPKFTKFLLTLLARNPEERPINPSAARTLIAELSPPKLPQLPRASQASAGHQPARPAATSTVAVQGPMQPPSLIPSPTQGRGPSMVDHETTAVPVVAMRPPPEIAAKLNLVIPETVSVYVTPAVGSQTQPFMTGSTQAVPAGVRTQPMGRHQAGTTAQPASRRVTRQQLAAPPTKSRAPLFLVLTILVLLSAGATGFYLWKNWSKLSSKEAPAPAAPVDTAEDLKAKIRSTN